MELHSRFLAKMRIVIQETHFLEDTPYGWRRIDVFAGGSFEGPEIKGIILSGGSDALLRRNDNVMQPDVRLTLKTDDGACIFVTYRGMRHGSDEVMTRIARGENVNPDEYYLRTAIFFETGSKRYEWLNRCIAVGVGQREPDAAVYQVYEIL